MNATHDTMSRDQVLRVLRRRLWVIVSCLAVGAAVGVALALLPTQRYDATATLLIEPAAAGASDADAPGGLTAQVAARLVRTRGVAERVSRELGEGRSPDELLSAVSAEPDDSGSFVTITATDATAAGAARLANAFADQLIAARADSVGERLQQAIVAGERQLERLPQTSPERSRLRSDLAELRATAALRAIDAEVIDPAVAAAGSAGVTPLRSGVIGGALALALGLVLAFALEALDPRVRTAAELRGLLRAPQLAAMPAPRLRSRRRPPPVLAARRQPFEHLRGALLVFNDERRLRRIVVTSPNDHHEGKTVVAANLALSLARMGLRVCAVDADLRRPALASQFGLDAGAAGLADVIRGTPLADAIQRFAIPTEDSANGSRPQPPAELSVVAAGSSSGDIAELLAGERMQEVLDQLGRERDVVILDCAPVLAASDALPLVERASGTILVVRHSHTPRRAVARAAQVVAEAQGTILGVVATAVPKAELAAEGYGPWPASASAVAGDDA